MLELLARKQIRLSSLVHDLPRVHVAHESVVTPWEHKGTVMRSLVEMTKDRWYGQSQGELGSQGLKNCPWPNFLLSGRRH